MPLPLTACSYFCLLHTAAVRSRQSHVFCSSQQGPLLASGVFQERVPLFQEPAGLDLARTMRIGSYRLLVFGPAYSLWLRFLEKKVQLPPARAFFAKMLLDQGANEKLNA